MGYTHYFPREENISDQQWSDICKAVKLAIKVSSVPVQFECSDPTPPQIDDSIIRFNGIDGDGHETFYLDRNSTGEDYNIDRYKYGFFFCKTARKPYDELVTAVLIIVNHYALGAFGIGSDGDIDDWQDGLMLVQTILPELDITLPGSETVTPAGNKVIVCPATYKDNVTCKSCKLCSIAKRPFIVSFPVHGTFKKKASQVVNS